MRLTSIAASALLALAGASGAVRAAPAQALATEAAAAQAAPGGPKLAFPLACQIGRTCEVQNYVDRDPGPGVLDYHCGHRTYNGHTGTDIRLLDLRMQKAGVNVLAAAPGKVLRLRDGVPDVLIRDPNAPRNENIGCGNAVVLDHGDGWITAYCHMARGSVRVKVGQAVAAGQPLGQVGLSGDTQFPHLHIEVRHDGELVDPFAPQPVAAGACAPQAEMWDPAAARALAYKRGAILNAGIAGEPVSLDSIEDGAIAPAQAASPAMVAYGRLIDLEKGDVIEVALIGPDGQPLAQQALDPLPRDQAQYFQMVGRKRPADGWKPGRYVAEVRVRRAGKVVLDRRIETRL